MPAYAAWLDEERYAVIVAASAEAVWSEAKRQGTQLTKVTELPLTVRRRGRTTKVRLDE